MDSPGRIILTPGDPAGIGPEVTVKALHRLELLPDIELTVVGSIFSLRAAASSLGLSLPEKAGLSYCAIESHEPGHVSYRSLEKATEMIAAKEADILVTGPISKRSLHESGYKMQGHTEILESLSQRFFAVEHAKAEMLFVHETFRLLLLTRHIPLADVSKALSNRKAVEGSFRILIDFLQHKLKILKPRLAVLGVNPHAGEIGGTEERVVFEPMLRDLQNMGLIHCDGPVAADGFFRGFVPGASPYDAIVAMYHDQGLIPFKLLAGYEAVNMTIGLPFLRTSVSHGTADNIVGKGVADEASLLAALHMAVKML